MHLNIITFLAAKIFLSQASGSDFSSQLNCPISSPSKKQTFPEEQNLYEEMTSLCETSKKKSKKDRKALQVQPSSPYFTRHDIKKELQEIQEYINQLGNILDNKTALSRWYNEVIEYKIIDERKQFLSSDADLELPPDDAKYHKEDMKLITEAQQRLYTLAEKIRRYI